MFNKEKNINDDMVNSCNATDLRLHIDVDKPGQNPIKVSFPVSVIKNFARMGNGISEILGNGSVDGIKFDEIMHLVENGTVGKLMDVVSDDNTHIIISIK